MSDRGFPNTPFGFRTKPVGGKVQTGRFDVQSIKVAVKRLVENEPKFTAAVLKDLQTMFLAGIKEVAPKDQGDYARSWRLGPIRGKKAYIITPQGKLFAWLEFTGTRAHSIDAKEGGPMLRFVLEDGTVVFTSHVDHPGTEAQPHARPLMRELLQAARVIIMANLDKYGSEFFKSSNLPPKPDPSKGPPTMRKAKVNKSGRKRIGRRGARARTKKGGSDKIY